MYFLLERADFHCANPSLFGAKNAKALSNLAWGSIDTEGGEWVEGTQPGDS